jgi:hypothetical protein
LCAPACRNEKELHSTGVPNPGSDPARPSGFFFLSFSPFFSLLLFSLLFLFTRNRMWQFEGELSELKMDQEKIPQ